MQPKNILVTGAKVHNLKNINVEIPLNKLVGIVGVSGSGKSSLALGVLYSEGSRRYLESLSTYTRRRLTQAEAANVEHVENVPAALALHQRPIVPNIRSTFGTGTELSNVLRLMFSRLGSHICPNGHFHPPTESVALDKSLTCPECGIVFMPPSAESFSFNSDGACPTCGGSGVIRQPDESTFVQDENLSVKEGAIAPWNQLMWSIMTDVCKEMGVRIDVPFKELTEKEKNIIFYGPMEKKHILYQSPKTGQVTELDFTFYSAQNTVLNSLAKAKDDKGLKKVSKFLKEAPCSDCMGTRLNKAARSSTIGGLTLPEVEKMPLSELEIWVKNIPNLMPDNLKKMAENISAQFLRYSKRLMELGLGYLSLDRSGATLSTGERQRMQLAKALRNETTGILYVLDEPSIGLHPKNADGLSGVINDLLTKGNSVVLVDHDVRIIKKCDYLIEMGEGAGENGGEVLGFGTVPEIINNPKSKIASFLADKEEIVVRKQAHIDSVFEKGAIHLETSDIYNVSPLRVDIPKGRLTAITGVSGSGKTTTVLEGLIPAIEAKISNKKLPSHVKKIECEGINKVSLIDSTPIGANCRSTVSTYSGISDSLRKVFASLPASKEKGLRANDFSYNTGSLRCPVCDGTGQVSMDVQFLPDINIECPDCKGLRYSKAANEIKYFGKNKEGVSVTDCMGMTVSQAISVFKDLKEVKNKLQILSDLGLSYLTLGEATPSLSGGEAQRLKLASDIGKIQEDAIFVFDEPSIGLHPLDVRVLINIFQTLIDNGATVVIIEHDLDLINNADYIIDMDINSKGKGEIVAKGTPLEIKNNKKSITGRYL